ncbi:MAG TPA: GntR family transcriptional regulator [Candidatus Enterococcus avicola]|uniref:GntR family transcriptional regulator n=1 Tax=Candidatus Enterococcus avicola TaxID=2838561 RepID=A0A9D2JJB7_9ENTE|nr:GntR family transcriptional regulator [Candidatus Enterococcus avicola]
MHKYQEVYTDIKRDILTNHYRAGHKFPTQEELTTKYGISRVTLKKVLNLLTDEGLIYSKQGSGTFVRQQMDEIAGGIMPLNSPIGTTYSHRGRKVTSKLWTFNARLPDEQEQKKLRIENNEPVYEIKRTRYIDGKTYSYEQTVMPTSIAPLSEDIANNSIYGYLGDKAKIFMTDARRVVFASSADKNTAKGLGISVGDPILVIKQTTYDQNGTAFEVSRSAFLADVAQFNVDAHRNTNWFVDTAKSKSEE